MLCVAKTAACANCSPPITPILTKTWRAITAFPTCKASKCVAWRCDPTIIAAGYWAWGSILALTSHTSRTSPTLRGKWILEVLFGSPPPPPPANAGQIAEEKGKGSEIKTFREKLAMHAQSAVCAACHRRMDPLGFALDHYDAVGRWRQTVGDQPLDVSGVLPTGEKMNGEDDLRQVLLARRSDFIRNLSEQMLTFALGRELDFYDDGPVLDIVAGLEKDDDRFITLVLGIVNSYPFRHRQNSPHND